jgi:hypothetical protein
MLGQCCRDVFTAPLRGNKRGAGHRKHRSSILGHFRFRRNAITEPLLALNYSGFQASCHNILVTTVLNMIFDIAVQTQCGCSHEVFQIKQKLLKTLFTNWKLIICNVKLQV